MTSLRILPVVLGLIALGCYAAFSAFLMLDLYLEYSTAGLVLRSLLPWAVLCNIVGIVMGITRARKDGKPLLVAGLIVNVVPPIVMVGSVLWHLFNFKM